MNKVKLHIGCGDKRLEGFTNIDVRPLESVDEVDDINYLYKYQENSIDLIYACHVMEHLGRLEYKRTLQRWHNLLKDGGVLRLAVPDIEMVFTHYNQHKDLKCLRGLLWGGQTYEHNFHYMGWDFKTLEQDLLDTGFKVVKRYDWKDTEHSHVDDYSQCYLPHLDKENGILMSLNVEAQK